MAYWYSLLRSTPPNREYFQAKKKFLFLSCSGTVFSEVLSLFALTIRLAVGGLSLSNFVIFELIVLIGLICQCLGMYNALKENLALAYVHLGLCGLAVLGPLVVGDNFLEDLACHGIFLVSAAIQCLLVRDWLYLAKHPEAKFVDATQNVCPNQNVAILLNWTQLILCCVNLILLAIGFFGLEIYKIYSLELIGQNGSECYHLYGLLLAATLCQIVAIGSVWTARLVNILAHVALCGFVLIGALVVAYKFEFQDTFWFTIWLWLLFSPAGISLTLAVELFWNWKGKIISPELKTRILKPNRS